MDVGEWQKRLEKYFSVNGTVGGRLIDVFDQETAYGQYVNSKFYGQRVLMDAFFSFFVETLNLAANFVSVRGWPKEYPSYGVALLYYITVFRSFRATDVLWVKGYPLDGYALLRDLKDRAIFLGALVHGITSIPKLFGAKNFRPGIKSITDDEFNKILKELKSEEHRILDKMIRKKSGLPPDVQTELQTWESLFNAEVHGSKLTLARGISWLQGQQPLQLGPVPDQSTVATYMNRASEVGWLIVRAFPFLQLEANAFGNDWTEKWKILDDSFKVMVEGLANAGKKIGQAIIVLANEKFSFPLDLHYHE